MGRQAGSVPAELTPGDTRRAAVSPAFPLTLTPAQHRRKAWDCLAFAGLDHCDDRLFDTIATIEHADDVAASIRRAGIMG